MYWPTVSCWNVTPNVTFWRCCESQKIFKTIRLHILGTMVILQNLSVVVAILLTTLIAKNVKYSIYLVFINTSYVVPSIAQSCNQYRMKVNVSCTLQCCWPHKQHSSQMMMLRFRKKLGHRFCFYSFWSNNPVHVMSDCHIYKTPHLLKFKN